MIETIICGLLALNGNQVEIWEPTADVDVWRLEKVILAQEIQICQDEVKVVDYGGHPWFIKPRVLVKN